MRRPEHLCGPVPLHAGDYDALERSGSSHGGHRKPQEITFSHRAARLNLCRVLQGRLWLAVQAGKNALSSRASW